MGVKMLLFAKWALKASKFFSIDFHYTWIEVTPDMSINVS